MLFIPVATPSRLPQHQSPMWWKPADGAIDPDVTHCKSVDSHRRMSNNRGIISDPEVGLRRPVDYWSEKGVGNRLIHLWQRQKKRSCFYSFSFSFSFSTFSFFRPYSFLSSTIYSSSPFLPPPPSPFSCGLGIGSVVWCEPGPHFVRGLCIIHLFFRAVKSV